MDSERWKFLYFFTLFFLEIDLSYEKKKAFKIWVSLCSYHMLIRQNVDSIWSKLS